MNAWKRMTAFRVGWSLPLMLAAQSAAADVAARFDQALQAAVPDRVFVYKSTAATELNLHVFDPQPDQSAKRAAVLWLHGGGWEAGQASQLFAHARYFAQLGFVGLSAEYRLAAAGSTTVFDCVEDARDAFYWVHANAAMLGIDPQRIVVAGESAGGHLAACVGFVADARDSGIPSPQPIPAATVLANPITDLTTLDWAMNKPGLSPSEPTTAQAISPLYHVDVLDPPALLLHGTADTVVPPGQSSDFADALQAAGIFARNRLWEGKSHAFLLYLPEYGLTDLAVIHSSLIEIEAFLQTQRLNAYPEVDGHFSPVHLFAGPDGFRSFSELVAADGILYGTTYKGGLHDAGTVFRFDPSTGRHDLLHAFSGSDGREVFNGLAISADTLYGVGKFGGDHNRGTLFAIGRDGAGFRVLHHFGASLQDGFYPHSAPIMADGILYGTTYHGGSSTYGGILYRYSLPDGPFEVIHSFTPATGRHPTGQLLRIGDWLYGTASDLFQHAGGYYGSLYRINIASLQFELLHTFNGADEGSHPYDRLVHDGRDLLFGSTFGEALNPASMGTLFATSITGGGLVVLHDFAASPGTGSKPNGSLVWSPDAAFLYGTSHGSNAGGGETGTLFRIRPDGSGFTLLHRFSSGLAGNTPMRSLVWCNGSYYGVTAFGGLGEDAANPETGAGMIFRYTPVADPAPHRSAFIDWLAHKALLVNQDPAADSDADRLSLIEEFAFDGDPARFDPPPPIRISADQSGALEVRLSGFRAVALPMLQPQTSPGLGQWHASTTHELTEHPNPDGDPAFSRIVAAWPAGSLADGRLFVRFSLRLP
jgi:uncharacterized repeat protein (TIGR03803 family)